MNNCIILENYFHNYKLIKFIEHHSFISFDKTIKLNILFNLKQYNYFINIKKHFKGNIKNCDLENNKHQKFTFILELTDIYILEYLSLIYDKKINNLSNHTSELYNDYIKLYYQLLNKDNAKYYYI